MNKGYTDNKWRECCSAYVKDSGGLMIEWLGEALNPRRQSSIIRRRVYLSSILWLLKIDLNIITGRYAYRDNGRCPWHNMTGVFGWQNYQGVTKAVKDDPDFEEHLGPIEIIPKEML